MHGQKNIKKKTKRAVGAELKAHFKTDF